jgi:hypothetical protein
LGKRKSLPLRLKGLDHFFTIAFLLAGQTCENGFSFSGSEDKFISTVEAFTDNKCTHYIFFHFFSKIKHGYNVEKRLKKSYKKVTTKKGKT